VNCIYDTPTQENMDTFKRYGITFKLEKKLRMGDRYFYSYVASGMEKLVVVPGFVEQYYEVDAKVKKFYPGKPLDAYLRLIKKNICTEFTVDEMPTDESEDGKLYAITCEYKDITVVLEYLNNSLRVAGEFEIRQNNIFGNGIVVAMNLGMEDEDSNE